MKSRRRFQSTTKPRHVQVFLASPGDVTEERRAVREAISRLNQKIRSHGYIFEAVGWEKLMPGFGRPQEVVNRELANCSVFIMLFGDRWGSPTGEYSSGTEEEFFKVIKSVETNGLPHLLVYFRLSVGHDEQAERVSSFRRWIEQNQICLYQTYDSPSHLKKLVQEHLHNWFLSRLKSVRELRTVPIDQEVFDRLELERRLLLQIAQSETERNRRVEAAVRLALKAFNAATSGDIDLALVLFSSALETADSPVVLNIWGVFLLVVGKIQEAAEVFETVVMRSRRRSAVWVYGKCNLAKIQLQRGETDLAISQFEECAEIAGAIGLPGIAGRAWSCIFEAYTVQGRDELAFRALSRATISYSKARNQVELAYVYNDSGVLMRRLGRFEEAFDFYDRALRAFEKAGDKEGEGIAIANLGIVEEHRGNFSSSEALFNKATRIFESLQNKRRLASCIGALGVLYWRQGKLFKAKVALEESEQIEREIENKAGLGHDLVHLSLVLGALGELGPAVEKAREAVRIYDGLRDSSRAQTSRQFAEGIERLIDSRGLGNQGQTSGFLKRVARALRRKLLWGSSATKRGG